MNSFWRCVSLLLFVVTAVAQTSIGENVTVDCNKNGSVEVRWRVPPGVDFTRTFLGSCFPTSLREEPRGLEIGFRFRLHQCRVKRQITAKWVIYSTLLTYKPLPRGKPPVISVPIECAYRRYKGSKSGEQGERFHQDMKEKETRPKGLFEPTDDPTFGTATGNGNLMFFMGIANENFSGPGLSSTFYLGSYIPIWAAVDQQSHLPFLLLLDECVASTSPEPASLGPVYHVIANGGCLLDSLHGGSRFLPRRRSSELLLLLESFCFAMGQEVYLHCTITAWDPLALNKQRKACHFNHALGGWELLDDPSQNSLCSCCESRCKYRERRSLGTAEQGVTHKATLGPIIINGPHECQNAESGDFYLLQKSEYGWLGPGSSEAVAAVFIQQRAPNELPKRHCVLRDLSE